MTTLTWFIFLISGVLASIKNDTEKAGWTAHNIPNPLRNPEACGRKNVPKSSICDPDDLMSDFGKDVLEGLTNGIHKNAEVGVLVIKRMDRSFVSGDSALVASKRFAKTIRNSWGVGDRRKQNGVLVFVSTEDRVILISSGRGIGNQLTPSRISSIIKSSKPALKNSDYDEALRTCVHKIGEALSSQRSVINSVIASAVPSVNASAISSVNRPPVSSTRLPVLDFLLGVLVMLLLGKVFGKAFYNAVCGYFRARQGRAALKSIAAEISSSLTTKVYCATSCPICLEDFPRPHQRKDKKEEAPQHTEERGVPEQETRKRKTAQKTTSIEASPHKAAGASAPGGAAAPQDTNQARPTELPCGHVFCCACIQCHLAASPARQCPVCRAPDDGRAGPAAGNDVGGYSAPEFAADMFSDADAWVRWRTAEAEYRVGRVQVLFPGTVGPAAQAELSAALAAGDSHAICRAVAAATGEWAAAAESGRGGASRDFGGDDGDGDGDVGGGDGCDGGDCDGDGDGGGDSW